MGQFLCGSVGHGSLRATHCLVWCALCMQGYVHVASSVQLVASRHLELTGLNLHSLVQHSSFTAL